MPEQVEVDSRIGATVADLRRAAQEVEEIAAIAETLQRSLLRERLPELVGMRLAARYRAGGADAQIGGDWYDVIALRNGRAGIAIGDVVGHGIDAAARMAHLKSALCAYALEGLRPTLVLERMNNFVRELVEEAMATLLFGIVDPDVGELRFASAGHPPPLILDPSGDARLAERSAASPLGAVPFPSYEDVIVPLEPGSVVLLYTDGLIERPAVSLDEGLAWLREYASGASRQPSELCSELLDTTFGSSSPRDDVALLAVRIEPLADRVLELTLPAEPESLATMRRALGRWLRGVGATQRESYELVVACGEACANAIAHAYAPGEASFVVTGRRAHGGVELRVSDFGRWRDPRANSRGRGLSLMENLVDGLDLDRRPDGTSVTIRRRLSKEPT